MRTILPVPSKCRGVKRSGECDLPRKVGPRNSRLPCATVLAGTSGEHRKRVLHRERVYRTSQAHRSPTFRAYWLGLLPRRSPPPSSVRLLVNRSSSSCHPSTSNHSNAWQAQTTTTRTRPSTNTATAVRHPLPRATERRLTPFVLRRPPTTEQRLPGGPVEGVGESAGWLLPPAAAGQSVMRHRPIGACRARRLPCSTPHGSEDGSLTLYVDQLRCNSIWVPRR